MCNEKTSLVKLRDKIGYMGHYQFLPRGHSWHRSLEFNGEIERDPPPREYSGDDMLKQFEHVNDSKPRKHPNNKDRKRKKKLKELNWTKKRIFFF